MHVAQGLDPRRQGFGAAAAQFIGRDREIEFLRVRQVQLVHQLHEVFLAAVVLEAGISRLLLTHGGHEASVVVVRRIDQGLVGEGEKLVVDRAVQGGGVPHLEVGPPAGVDQQRIAGEQPGSARGMEQEGVMGVGVPRRKQRMDLKSPDTERFAFTNPDIPARQVVHCSPCDLAVGDRLELESPAHVIGMDVRLQGISEFQAHLVQDFDVPVHRLHHRVDKHGLAGLRTAEQIGVCERFRFEQLPENHDEFFLCEPLGLCLRAGI